jgi:hypothetical protein
VSWLAAPAAEQRTRGVRREAPGGGLMMMIDDRPDIITHLFWGTPGLLLHYYVLLQGTFLASDDPMSEQNEISAVI